LRSGPTSGATVADSSIGIGLVTQVYVAGVTIVLATTYLSAL
jgi:hypothetical protein